MAGKIRFITHNEADLSTNIAATSELLPADNMQLIPRSKIWRSTGTSLIFIVQQVSLVF